MRLLVYFLFFVITHTAFAQTDARSHIERGIEQYDAGQYQEALASYSQALAAEPNSAFAHYEIALTYLELKEYAKAERYAKRAVKLDPQGSTGLQAYVLWGTSLSEQGKVKKAVKTYQRGIDGGLDHYLLPFNQGVAYIRLNKPEKAQRAYRQALTLNPLHPSSHYSLAYLADATNERFPAILGSYFYLLLENDREPRNVDMLRVIEGQLFRGIQRRDSLGGLHIAIAAGTLLDDNPWTGAELLLSLGVGSQLRLADSLDLSPVDRLILHTEYVFGLLPEVSPEQLDAPTAFYVDFFGALHDTEHVATLVRYALSNINDDSRQWTEAHPDEVAALLDWANAYLE